MRIIRYAAKYTVASGRGSIKIYLENANPVYFNDLPAQKFIAIVGILDSGANLVWDGVNIELNEYV